MSEYAALIELGEIGEIPGHTQNALELFLLLKGRAQFVLDGYQYRMNENDIILCNSGQVHSAKGEGPNIALRLQIPEQFMYQELGQSEVRFHCVCCGEPGAEQPDGYEKLIQLLTRLMLVHYQKGPGHGLEFKSTLLQLLALLLSHFQAGGFSASKESSGDSRIDRIVSHIQANFREDVGLQELADQEHMSVHYLSRLFKKKLGTGFTEYLNQVRMGCAVNDLLHTRDSVIKIALNNGFSNVNSFNRLFRQAYGESPARYRTRRQVAMRQQTSTNELNKVFQEESDLISYLRRFDVRNQSGDGDLTEISLDAAAKPIARMARTEIVIRAGKMGELLKSEVQNQLRQLKDHLDIDAVHMQCVFNDGMTDYSSVIYTQHAYMQVMEFLLGLGVHPVFSFSVEDLLGGEKGSDAIAEFLGLIRSMCTSADRENWRFEVTYPDHMLSEVRHKCYRAVRGAVRAVVPEAAVGLRFVQRGSWDKGYGEQYVKFFRELDGDAPDFISFCLELPLDLQFGQDGDYHRYQGYTARQIRRLARQFADAELTLPEILLMDWTTLASHGEGASKTFFRSALIVEEILHFAPHVKGMAFWLSYYVEEAIRGKQDRDSLAMYLLYQLKLPVYFSMCLMDILYPEVIYHKDHILATRSKDGDLAILVYNPCYFDPSMAADQMYTRGKRRSYRLRVNEIYSKLVIELYHMDNHRTAFYGQWASMGFPGLHDKNGTEHLERSVNLVYSTLEEQQEGECVLSATLDYNETAVFRLRNNRPR